MSNVEKMSIALTPEMAAAIREAVARGEYVSSSEVVREALRDWQLRRAMNEAALEELRAKWQEGIDSGPGRFETMQDLRAEARRRLLEQHDAPAEQT